MSIALANRYWLVWFLVLLVSFLVPELYCLFSGHAGGTLSETVWRLENMVPGKRAPWTFAHYMFTAGFAVIFFWLFWHFGWGMFR